MNPEIKALWTAALRSGEYEQGEGALHMLEDGKHTWCCLGVLCDVAVKAGVIPEPFIAPKEEQQVRDYYGYDHYTNLDGDDEYEIAFLPAKVIEWAGVEGGNPVIGDWSASTLNDSDGKSFAEIADLVDEHL